LPAVYDDSVLNVTRRAKEGRHPEEQLISPGLWLSSPPALHDRRVNLPGSVVPDERHFIQRIFSWFRAMPERIGKEVDCVRHNFKQAVARSDINEWATIPVADSDASDLAAAPSR